MFGSALVRRLQRAPGVALLVRGREELDLTSQPAVAAFLASERPEAIIVAAARVGGIHANSTYPAEFLHDNLVIAANTIHAAWRAGVPRLLFLGSSCVYPRLAPQPITEDSLLTSALEPTNEAYAIAKIAGLKLCQPRKQSARPREDCPGSGRRPRQKAGFWRISLAASPLFNHHGLRQHGRGKRRQAGFKGRLRHDRYATA